MKTANVDKGVDPRKQLTLVILWATFNILACLGFFTLFITGLFIRRARRNPVLLSFFASFTIATAAGAVLSYTGYALTLEVPIPLCVVSAAFGSSWSMAQTGAACALVIKVWAHAMLLNRPQSKTLQYLTKSWLMVALPWVIALPFWFAAFGIGMANPDMVSRASPLYCTLNLNSMNIATLIFDFAFELTAVILAAWTALIISQTRGRTRDFRAVSSDNHSYMSLSVRTIIFVLLLTITFGANLGTAFTSYSAPVPDVITAIMDFLAVFVFGSDPQVLRVLWSCKRQGESSHGPNSYPNGSVAIEFSMETHVARDSANRPPTTLELSSFVGRGRVQAQEWKLAAVDRDEMALPHRKNSETVIDRDSKYDDTHAI